MNVKRPSALFLGAIILGIISQSWGNRYIDKIIVLSIGFFLYTILFLIYKLNIKTYLILLLIFILSSYRFLIIESFYNRIDRNIDSFNNKSQIITAEIENFGKSKNSNYIVIKNVNASDKYLYRSMCYYKEEYDFKIGNKIKINGYVNKYSIPMNEGEFNSHNYYRSINISNMIYAKEIELVDNNYNKVLQKIYDIKMLIKNQIYRIFNNRNAGLFTAMLLGDKSGIELDQKKLFSENGIAHIIAISGLHLSILGLALFELLRKKLSVNVSATIVSIFILFYAIFIDASIVTLRAISMLYIRFLSLVIKRTYDSNNTLFIVAIISILYNPYLIFNQGFQFSYIAVFSLNYQYRLYKNKNLKIIDRAKKFLKIKINNYYKIPEFIILTLFLLPITIYNYFSYPTYSILLNLIIIPLMPIVLLFGIIGVFLSFINVYLGRFFAGIVHFVFVFYEKLCNGIDKLPYNQITFGRQTIISIIIYYLVLFSIHFVLYEYMYYKKYNKINILHSYYTNINNIKDSYNDFIVKIKNTFVSYIESIYKVLFNTISYCLILIICIVIIFFNLSSIKNRHIYDMRISSLYIGQGDCFIIQKNNTYYMMDAGSTSNNRAGEYVLAPHLKSRGINNIDIVFVSHADSDHTNAIIYLLENEYDITIKNLVMPIQAKTNERYNIIKNVAKNRNVNILYMKTLDKLNIDETTEFICLSPDINDSLANEDINEQSLVIKFSYNDKSMLFTGDIGKQTEYKLINNKQVNNYLQSDIFKVCHHGSRKSNDRNFISKINPKIAVISCGINNSYSHPSKNTIKTLNNQKIDIFQTDKEGQIDFLLNDNITVNTYYTNKHKIYD